MKRFTYKAIGENGETTQGEMHAADSGAVIDKLQSSGFFPIAIRELSTSTLGYNVDSLFDRRVGRTDILNLTRELATMLNAGLPLSQALNTLALLANKSAIRDVLDRIRAKVEAGAPLSHALEDSDGPFTPFYVSLVRAGEASGALEVVLQRLAEYLERAQQLREAVLSAMLYPAILLVVSGGSLIVLLTYVVPQFEPLFADLGQSLPVSTQIVIAMADGVRKFWWAILIALFATYTWVKLLFANKRWRQGIDRVLLRLPLFGSLNVRLALTRIFSTLGTLTGNGVALLEALRIVNGTVGNEVMRRSFETATSKLEQGHGLSQSLAEASWFPPLATQLLRVGEETGKLSPMLLKLADIYDVESQRAIKRALALLEPALILGLGLLIAFIIIAILLAILGLNELVV